MNFKVITGYPDYLISESGEIFSLKSDRNLKPYKTTKGYLQVRLDSGKAFHAHRKVERLLGTLNRYFNCPWVERKLRDGKVQWRLKEL